MKNVWLHKGQIYVEGHLCWMLQRQLQTISLTCSAPSKTEHWKKATFSWRVLEHIICCWCSDTVARLPAKRLRLKRDLNNWVSGLYLGKRSLQSTRFHSLMGPWVGRRWITIETIRNPHRSNACRPSLSGRHCLALVSHVCALPVNTAGRVLNFKMLCFIDI